MIKHFKTNKNKTHSHTRRIETQIKSIRYCGKKQVSGGDLGEITDSADLISSVTFSAASGHWLTRPSMELPKNATVKILTH